jgi:hypothetical protein
MNPGSPPRAAGPLRARHALGRAARKPVDLVVARAVAHGEARLDAELARLLHHRPAGRVHAAMEDDVGLPRLDPREDRLEIRFLVRRALARDDLHLRGPKRLVHLDAIPSPYAVLSSTIATFFAFICFAM